MVGVNSLSPSQREAYDGIVAALPAGHIFELRAKTGRGRTTVLQALHATLGGAMLTLRDFSTSWTSAIPWPWKRPITR